ncbi:unnamed protein product [Scytosiphon promiscuus]
MKREKQQQHAAGVASVTRSSNPLRTWARAKIVLRNESDYLVSYWVLHEDKLTTLPTKLRVFRNMEDYLNDGGTDPIHAEGNNKNNNNNVKRARDMINAENALDHEYFVIRDCRPGATTGIKVCFPGGCRQLRVYAYAWFEKEQEWRVIKDKICDNGRGRTRFTLSASNETVQPFEL